MPELTSSDVLTWQAILLDKKTIGTWKTWALSDHTVRAVGSRIANLIDDAPGIIARLLTEVEHLRANGAPDAH